MKGEQLLTELAELARRQSMALADDDLAEFGRLADERDGLIAALAQADWVDREGAEPLVRDLLARDARNRAALARQIVTTAQMLAATRRGLRTLRGYGGLAGTSRETPALLDRTA